MRRTIIDGTNTLLHMAENLYKRGEINAYQYNEMVRRNNAIPEEHRQNVVIAQ